MRRVRDSRLTLEQSSFLTHIRTMGVATALPVYLHDAELARLAGIIVQDVGLPPGSCGTLPPPVESPGYYECPLSWFSDTYDEVDFTPVYLNCRNTIPDFDTFLGALAALHKRRRKYAQILSKQPLPKMVQVAPRALLEFGIMASPALASWMTWRKWFYDIDNRSAQETGYLFEPILASSLGGMSYGARNSPIRRRTDRSKGRQVDCVVGQTAYEFKLRVTIAASGQGRFGEELDFAEDCHASGYRPVLLVLDPTPSHRLDDLTREFERVGGEAYVGDEAWLYLEQQAGPTMATFVEKYVRRPIKEIDIFTQTLLNLSIEQSSLDGTFFINLYNNENCYRNYLYRHEDKSLSTEEDVE